MSRKRKGKYQPLQSKKKKSRQSPSLAVSRTSTVLPVEEAATDIGATGVEPVVVQPEMALAARNPELLVELRRIGILAAVMLSALIILVIVLG